MTRNTDKYFKNLSKELKPETLDPISTP